MNAASQGRGFAEGLVRQPRRYERIGPLTDVNTLCLQWLAEGARHPGHLDVEFLDVLGSSLSALSESSLLRAAQVPFLLVDLRFKDHDWWRDRSVRRSEPPNSATLPVSLHDPTTIGLARSTLVLAWHTARVDREAALIMLGLSPTVADLLSQIHLQDIDWISARHCQELQPRWASQPTLWRRLLASDGAGDDTSSCAFALRGLQLVAGDMLAVS